MNRSLTAGALCTALGFFLSAPLSSASAQSTEDVLRELHEQLVLTQMVDRDPAFLLAHSSEAYTVVAPGGVVENRDQVIAGLGAFAQVDSVSLERVEVRVTGPTAVVFSRQTVHGQIRGPAAGFGPLSTTTAFSRASGGNWIAVSRSLTPCHPRALEMGRC